MPLRPIMHEYSIVQALLSRVEAEALSHSASTVYRLKVRVGEVSGVEAGLLRSAYELARQRTRCENAELEIVTVPARWACPDCAAPIAGAESLRCPECGVPGRLMAGDEIFLDQIEMEAE